MRRREFLWLAALAGVSAKTSCGSTAKAAPTPRGGVYVLEDSQGRIRYVGRSVNLAQRLAHWARKFPDLAGRVVIRSDNYAVQRGGEELVYQRAQVQAERGGYAMYNKIRPVSPGSVNRDIYLKAAKDWVSSHPLLSSDPLDYGRG